MTVMSWQFAKTYTCRNLLLGLDLTADIRSMWSDLMFVAFVESGQYLDNRGFCSCQSLSIAPLVFDLPRLLSFSCLVVEISFFVWPV